MVNVYSRCFLAPLGVLLIMKALEEMNCQNQSSPVLCLSAHFPFCQQQRNVLHTILVVSVMLVMYSIKLERPIG